MRPSSISVAFAALLVSTACERALFEPPTDALDASVLPTGRQIVGRVDGADGPLRGARARLDHRMAGIPESGNFALEAEPGPVVLRVEAARHVPIDRPLEIDGAAHLRLFTATTLTARRDAGSLDAALGGEVHDGGGLRLTLPPSAFATLDGGAIEGEVRLQLTRLSPMAAPGSTATPAVTRAVFDVAAHDARGPLRLAGNARPVVRITTADAAAADLAPAVFDRVTAAWLPAGELSDEGDALALRIDRLGTWRVAHPPTAGCVTGVVFDRWARPIIGARIAVDWPDERARAVTHTDGRGRFVVGAPANAEAAVHVAHGRWEEQRAVAVGAAAQPIEADACADSGTWTLIRDSIGGRAPQPMDCDPHPLGALADCVPLLVEQSACLVPRGACVVAPVAGDGVGVTGFDNGSLLEPAREGDRMFTRLTGPGGRPCGERAGTDEGVEVRLPDGRRERFAVARTPAGLALTCADGSTRAVDALLRDALHACRALEPASADCTRVLPGEGPGAPGGFGAPCADAAECGPTLLCCMGRCTNRPCPFGGPTCATDGDCPGRICCAASGHCADRAVCDAWRPCAAADDCTDGRCCADARLDEPVCVPEDTLCTALLP